MFSSRFVLPTLFATLVTLSSLAPAAHADERDLRIYNVILGAGAATENFMSQSHAGIQGIECVTMPVGTGADAARQTRCTFHDISAEYGQGADVTAGGEGAEALSALLVELGAAVRADEPVAGASTIRFGSIGCHQAMDGVMDGDTDVSEANRTSCDFEVTF